MKVVFMESPAIKFGLVKVGELFSLENSCDTEFKYYQDENLFMRIPELDVFESESCNSCDMDIYPSDERDTVNSVHLATGTVIGLSENAKVKKFTGEIRVTPA